jgi:acetyl-CoA carboxylase biotin carboxylase subunit
MPAFDKVLIANRGEIARRILRTCHSLGYATVAVCSEADRGARFVGEADEAVVIGPAPSVASYLNIQAILDAARRTGAQAIHPGYGFLAENAVFARACEDAGIVFIGPRSESIVAMGSKLAAKRLMVEHGVPVIPGTSGDEQDADGFVAWARQNGFPVLVKASAGGGGKGMRVVRSEAELRPALEAARREALGAFGDDTLLLERYLDRPRHIEFQIFGDEYGRVVHLHERECSIQRRHQKIVEETPSPGLDEALRKRMAEAAVAAGKAIRYRSAGTVELVLAPDGNFYFLEVNTRLQVEHPVTELTTGLDLVALQLAVARGEPLPFAADEVPRRGAAIECRLYAEDPARGFLPQAGRVLDWCFELGPGLRLDSGVETGDEVPVHYDPLLAKLVAWGETREIATRRLARALRRASVQGIVTNRAFLLDVLEHPAWQEGALHTHFIEEHFPDLGRVAPARALVEEAAIAATVHQIALRRPARASLVDLPAGWRNSPFRLAEECWRAGDEEVVVRYRALGHDRYAFELGEPGSTREVELAETPVGPALELWIDGRRRRFRVVLEAGRAHLRGPAGEIVLQLVERLPEPREVEPRGTCTAPMPGKVLAVLVSPGERVQKGQTLVRLEAMKMEHAITAPRDGVLAEVRVTAGELVRGDHVLCVLEEEA